MQPPCMIKSADKIRGMAQQNSVGDRLEHVALFSFICRLIRTVIMLKAAVPVHIIHPGKIFR